MRKIVIILLLIIGISQTAKSKGNIPQVTLSDTAQVSLLTSAPWNGAIYSLFGHSAIRVKDLGRNIDSVFNYGIFNFQSPNFILRFVKGETDYMVAVVDYKYYIEEYQERGVAITEQVFNLSWKEKQDIFNALTVNSMPQNRVYRYNFFYDNCATRPRDIIEKYTGGKIEYTLTGQPQTYRDLVWECVNVAPWVRFGIDLVIGADADKIITDRQKDFLPIYLFLAYKGATVTDVDGLKRNLVSAESMLLPSTSTLDYSPFDQPFYAGLAFFAFTALLSLLVYKKRWFAVGKLFDTLLFLAAGAAGSIIFFLMFFSEHPCTNPNWNIVWLNPIQLIVALLFFVKSFSKGVYYYHFINFAALLIFLLAWSLIPQKLELAFIPYISAIALRSLMNILQHKMSKKRAGYSLPRMR